MKTVVCEKRSTYRADCFSLRQTYFPGREIALEDTSVDESQNTYKQFYCQAEKAEGVKHTLIFLAALNIFLSVTAILGNILILVALDKISSVRSASKFLHRNLATTDLFVGITAQPLMVVHWISAEKGQFYGKFAEAQRWQIFSPAIFCVPYL